jgi:hypothetical protein
MKRHLQELRLFREFMRQGPNLGISVEIFNSPVSWTQSQCPVKPPILDSILIQWNFNQIQHPSPLGENKCFYWPFSWQDWICHCRCTGSCRTIKSWNWGVEGFAVSIDFWVLGLGKQTRRRIGGLRVFSLFQWFKFQAFSSLYLTKR